MKTTFSIKIDQLEKIIEQVKQHKNNISSLSETIEFQIKEPAKWHNESDKYIAFCQSVYAECFPKFICENI